MSFSRSPRSSPLVVLFPLIAVLHLSYFLPLLLLPPLPSSSLFPCSLDAEVDQMPVQGTLRSPHCSRRTHRHTYTVTYWFIINEISGFIRYEEPCVCLWLTGERRIGWGDDGGGGGEKEGEIDVKDTTD